jgi:hypothetical protein
VVLPDWPTFHEFDVIHWADFAAGSAAVAFFVDSEVFVGKRD